MLGPQSWFRSARANVHDPEIPVRHKRERQRAAQYLPPAFTFGSIDLDHRRISTLRIFQIFAQMNSSTKLEISRWRELTILL